MCRLIEIKILHTLAQVSLVQRSQFGLAVACVAEFCLLSNLKGSKKINSRLQQMEGNLHLKSLEGFCALDHI